MMLSCVTAACSARAVAAKASHLFIKNTHTLNGRDMKNQNEAEKKKKIIPPTHFCANETDAEPIPAAKRSEQKDGRALDESKSASPVPGRGYGRTSGSGLDAAAVAAVDVAIFFSPALLPLRRLRHGELGANHAQYYHPWLPCLSLTSLFCVLLLPPKKKKDSSTRYLPVRLAYIVLPRNFWGKKFDFGIAMN